MYKRTFIALALLLPIKFLVAQQKPVHFYDILPDGRVIMYMNEDFQFTEKSCALYKRYTRIDSAGDFSRDYVDSSFSNTIVSKGFYVRGKKRGFFTFYYPNGNIKSKGEYENNIPIGIWEYFYENGILERTLKITGTDVQLVNYVTTDGQHSVKNGNGIFSGDINIAGITYESSQIEIKNGKPNGTWILRSKNGEQISAVYAHGIMIKSKQKIVDQPIIYRGYPLEYNFLPSNYLMVVERFKTVSCNYAKDPALINRLFTEKHILNSGTADFYHHTSKFIKKKLGEDEIHNFTEYRPGKNHLIFSFTVNKKQVPDNFKKLTLWGDNFYTPLLIYFTRYAKLHPNKENRYFHLIITRDKISKLSYEYYFSQFPTH